MPSPEDVARDFSSFDLFFIPSDAILGQTSWVRVFSLENPRRRLSQRDPQKGIDAMPPNSESTFNIFGSHPAQDRPSLFGLPMPYAPPMTVQAVGF